MVKGLRLSMKLNNNNCNNEILLEKRLYDDTFLYYHWVALGVATRYIYMSVNFYKVYEQSNHLYL